MQDLQDNETYQQVLKDSFGGIMYNVANRDKYNAKEVLELWDNMGIAAQSAAGGIMKGAINFLQGN